MTNYDVIGDVHGQDAKLRTLLRDLGYREHRGAWRHPEGRQAIFVGDLIDRGPGQREVVSLVRRMQDAGSGLAVLGNHELNAIGFATRNRAGNGWLRPHTGKNLNQHHDFLHQVGWKTPLHRELVRWFRSLPVALDLGGIRVCHAWWDDARIAAVRAASDAEGRLAESYLRASFVPGRVEHLVLEGLTKGLEIELPDGGQVLDHAGQPRTTIRVRWWDAGVSTYRAAALIDEAQRDGLPDTPLPAHVDLRNRSAVPVFVGHYWLNGRPGRQNGNTAVLDYSAGMGGPLVAYRWNGETELRDDAFIATSA